MITTDKIEYYAEQMVLQNQDEWYEIWALPHDDWEAVLDRVEEILIDVDPCIMFDRTTLRWTTVDTAPEQPFVTGQ